MVKFADLDVSDNHPLSLELKSLKTTIARLQDEVYTASIKLQRHSLLDAAHTGDHITQLEQENEVLRKEITILRAHPHPDTSPDAHPAVSQVRQLTLSLRQLSDKLSHTEEALLARTADLAHALSKAKKARHSADGAHELAAHMRRRQEDEMAIERELRLKLEMAEEGKRMSDLVVKEYADLVRSLEQRLQAQSTLTEKDGTSVPIARRSSTPSLAESLEKGKLGLQRLVAEFAEESERLRREISQLQSELAESRAQTDARKKIVEQHYLELAKVQTELQKLKIDDNTAAKMVSRYMKFSQASTDALQTALSTLKARHAATVDTLSTQVSHVTRRLQDTEVTCEQLRGALDDLGGDYMKESYGRRKEVALRIKLINREEKLMESLRRWILRAQETFDRIEDVSAQESLAKIVNEATMVLLSNDGPLSQPPSASLARILAVQTAAESLTNELYVESKRRLELQMALTTGREDQLSMNVDCGGNAYRESGTQYELSSSSVAVQTSNPQNPLLISPLMIGSPSIDPGISLANFSEQNFNANIPRDASLEGTLAMNTDKNAGNENHETATLTIATTIAQTHPCSPIGSPSTSSTQDHVDDLVHALADNTQLDDVNPAEIRTDTNFDAMVTQGQGITAIAQQPLPEVVVEQANDTPQSLLLSAPHEKCDISAILIPDISSTQSDTEGTEALSPQHQSEPPIVFPSSEQQKHPLITSLHKVNHRYNNLQRDFHDCYFALDSLKQSLATSSLEHQISSGALRLALERLTDYIEDARVELEIRIADESLLAHGYETLLSVPGALGSPDPTNRSGQLALVPSQVEQQIEAFVLGTESSIQKAQESLTRKLSDVQHDIAILKKTIHGLEEEGSPAQSEEFGLSLSPLLGSVPATAPLPSTRAGGWTSWIRASSSRPSSPAPTFGSVMTSPHLRHPSSLNQANAGRSGKPYLFNDDAGSKDPLASLRLRVPMPVYVPPQVPVYPIARPRTVSTMYMLGLGARTPSGSLTPLLSPRRKVEPSPEVTDDGHDDVE